MFITLINNPELARFSYGQRHTVRRLSAPAAASASEHSMEGRPMIQAGNHTPCSATVLHARGRRLCKTIHADGIMRPYGSAKTFDFYPVEFENLAGLHDLLRDLVQQRKRALVRGAAADPKRGSGGMRRLLHADGEACDAATLHEVRRCWVALDVDCLPRPPGTAQHVEGHTHA